MAVIQEAYIQGASTRPVADLVQAMGMSGISSSQVSRLATRSATRSAASWSGLWTPSGPISLRRDATYVKVREAGRIVSVAVTIAVATNDEGRREVLGMAIGASEAETFRTEFPRSLARRGLPGVRLVISDDHKSPKAAATRVLAPPGRDAGCTSCGICWPMPASRDGEWSRPSSPPLSPRTPRRQATSEWRQVADQLRGKAPRLAARMDEAEHDVVAFMSFPEEHRVRVHSTNPLERLRREIKRPTNVVGILPNQDAVTRLIGAIPREQNDEGAV